MMTKEQLLIPRYLVISDFPNNDKKVGAVFAVATHSPYPQRHFDQYPNIYKKLQWHEDRKPEDMPEYVISKPIFESDNVKYYKVSEWYMYKQPVSGEEMIGFNSPDGYTIGAHAVLPIDESENLDYAKQ